MDRYEYSKPEEIVNEQPRRLGEIINGINANIRSERENEALRSKNVSMYRGYNPKADEKQVKKYEPKYHAFDPAIIGNSKRDDYIEGKPKLPHEIGNILGCNCPRCRVPRKDTNLL